MFFASPRILDIRINDNVGFQNSFTTLLSAYGSSDPGCLREIGIHYAGNQSQQNMYSRSSDSPRVAD